MAARFADDQSYGHHQGQGTFERGDPARDAHRTGRHGASLPAR
jgi:hypothetical protein